MSTYTPTSSRMRTRVVHTQTRRQPHQPSNQATNQPTRSKPNNQQSSERTFIVFVRGRVRDGRLKTLASWKKTHTDRTKRETNRKQKKKKNTKHTNTQANKRTGTPSQEMLLDGGWLFGVGDVNNVAVAGRGHTHTHTKAVADCRKCTNNHNENRKCAFDVQRRP